MEDTEVKVGQVWEYRSKNPFHHTPCLRYKVLEIRDGYVCWRMVGWFLFLIRGSCSVEWFKTGAKLIGE